MLEKQRTMRISQRWGDSLAARRGPHEPDKVFGGSILQDIRSGMRGQNSRFYRFVYHKMDDGLRDAKVGRTDSLVESAYAARPVNMGDTLWRGEVSVFPKKSEKRWIIDCI